MLRIPLLFSALASLWICKYFYPTVISGNLTQEYSKDDVWPLRPPTYWDISTDFPYPRTITYEVEEGTWLRLDVHPVSGDIVFDMAGDLYCLPASSYLGHSTNTVARPVLRGVPHDADPHFSPDGRILAFRSDAELGIENIWALPWKGCDEMDLDRDTVVGSNQGSGEEHDATLLASGTREAREGKERRLLREGRAEAIRVTNETYRWVTDPRFHPSGSFLVATKWYSSRGVPAGEGWRYDVPLNSVQTIQSYIGSGSGTRLLGRIPLSAQQTLQDFNALSGPEQFIWRGTDSLIYSKNDKDDGSFSYSKDVHKGIYAIYLYNLTTQRTELLVDSFPGGASRPELSRDGRTLAFVRRVRDKEALVLKDLITGTIHHAWYGLNYDLSIISAPMGTYPSFAFTPSDNAIIIWAAGQIHHVPLATNSLGEKVRHPTLQPRPVKFRARIVKSLATTLRGGENLVKHETADRMRILAFKDLKVDYNGAKVIFQGAGKTYLHSVHHGETEGVQIHTADAYYTPGFVPSHNNSEDWIIHVQWSEQDFSSSELVDVRCEGGRGAYLLEGLPVGRYFSPVISHDSGRERKIAFIKMPGDYITGNVVATAGEGVYIGDVTLPHCTPTPFHKPASIQIGNLTFFPSETVTSPAFKMRFPTERSQLQFSEDGRYLLVQQEDRVFTIDLDGGPDITGKHPHRTLSRGSMSSEISVSNSWARGAHYAAFVDFFQVYVVPLPLRIDEPLWSKPGNATSGLMRVSTDGGHDIAWSGDGKKLFWLSGPTLYSIEVSRLFQCRRAAEDDPLTFGIDCTKDLLETTEIVVDHETDVSRLKKEAQQAAKSELSASPKDLLQQPFQLQRSIENADVLVVQNATILSMQEGHESEEPMRNGTLISRGGIFIYVGPTISASSFPGAKIIDAQGGFVIPGFIDMHAHWIGFTSRYPAKSFEMEGYLAYGVTTLHNPSGNNVDSFNERSRIERGQLIGPRIFSVGDIIYGDDTPGLHQDITTMDEAQEAINRIKVEGGHASISYKNYILHSRASRQRLLLAARKMNMSCVPEGGMNSDWDLTYIIDGMTTLEHAYPIPTLYDDILMLFSKSGTAYTPTHLVNYGGVWGEQMVWAQEDLNNDTKLRRFMRHDYLERLSESSSRPKDSYALFNTSTSAAKMVQMGLKVLIGAHGEPPLGFNYHAEMWFTKQGGLSNYEVMRAATYDAAATLGLQGSLGSLSVGKLADFLIYPPDVDLLNGDITGTRALRYVVRGGRVWEADTMTEVWPVKGRKQKLPPFNPD